MNNEKSAYFSFAEMSDILKKYHCQIRPELLEKWIDQLDFKKLSRTHGPVQISWDNGNVKTRFPRPWFGNLLDQNRDWIHEQITHYDQENNFPDSKNREQELYNRYSNVDLEPGVVSSELEKAVDDEVQHQLVRLALMTLQVDLDRLYEDAARDEIDSNILTYLGSKK
ncbi:hypothetical protein [Companilactobacillus furfuricola]|uniref:hypothetical protein n=1 Tax=Companilactobacillus furfuricola TaxID=1462575 RepID=UPI000F77E4C2|nr:hypothetical protein [Companilactobacillus furfuricola]